MILSTVWSILLHLYKCDIMNGFQCTNFNTNKDYLLNCKNRKYHYYMSKSKQKHFFFLYETKTQLKVKVESQCLPTGGFLILLICGFFLGTIQNTNG